MPSDDLAKILELERPTAVVDIGANPIDAEPPYRKMLADRLCTVVGFEPQAAALERLNAHKSDFETYLPYAIGDGAPAMLRTYAAPGLASLLRIDHSIARVFNLHELGKLEAETPIETLRLDDVREIAALDLLKIDAQGSELTILENGKNRLADAVAVHTEVSFVPLYEGQATYRDIDAELHRHGFIPHSLAWINKRMIAPIYFEDRPFAALNQVFEADVVYVRDFTKRDRMNTGQLKHLAMIAHHCYGSYDLTMNCLYHLAARRAMSDEGIASYLANVQRALAKPDNKPG
jgi:FkbM family methyltransferase